MAHLGFAGGFNANDVAPTGVFHAPAGRYLMAITSSEMKPTSTGGQMLVLEMQIVEGPHKGITATERLNLVNKNPQAVEFARGTLSAICRAVGKMQASDSAELHGLPMLVTLAVEDYKRTDGTDGHSNRPKKYEPRSAAANGPIVGRKDGMPWGGGTASAASVAPQPGAPVDAAAGIPADEIPF